MKELSMKMIENGIKLTVKEENEIFEEFVITGEARNSLLLLLFESYNQDTMLLNNIFISKTKGDGKL